MWTWVPTTASSELVEQCSALQLDRCSEPRNTLLWDR